MMDLNKYTVSINIEKVGDPTDHGTHDLGVLQPSAAGALVALLQVAAQKWAADGDTVQVVDLDGNLRTFKGLDLD